MKVTSLDVYRNLYNLEGKVALVAGGAGGIGSAICEGLAAFGATVVICGRTGTKAKALAAQIEAAGGRAWGAGLDILDPAAVDRFIGQILEMYGHLDILVNSAGTHKEAPAEDYEESDWDRVLDLNLKAAFFLSQAVARAQIPRGGGKQIHISSVRSQLGSRRGGLIVSTETAVTDERGWAILGSKSTFLKTRAKGTERSDIPDARKGASKFFEETPVFITYDEPCNVELVVLPAIDGNFDTKPIEMIPFEKGYQTNHSLINYHGLHQLLAPGLPMPIIDTDKLRLKGADFCHRFARRPSYLIRAANPQLLLDEVEKLL